MKERIFRSRGRPPEYNTPVETTENQKSFLDENGEIVSEEKSREEFEEIETTINDNKEEGEGWQPDPSWTEPAREHWTDKY